MPPSPRVQEASKKLHPIPFKGDKTMTSGNNKPIIAADSTACERSQKTGAVNSLQTVNKLYLEELETTTETLGIRIPLKYYIIYKKAVAKSRRKREILKKIVSEAIVKLAELTPKPEGNNTVILNINIAMAEAKAENKPTMDSEILLEKIRILEAEKKELKDAMKYYKKRYDELSEIVRKMPENLGDKYIDYRKLNVLLQLVKKAKELVK